MALNTSPSASVRVAASLPLRPSNRGIQLKIAASPSAANRDFDPPFNQVATYPVTVPSLDGRDISGQSSSDGAIRWLARKIVGLWKAVRREFLVASAVSKLSELDDRTLRDIGLERHRIAHSVRYGRSCE